MRFEPHGPRRCQLGESPLWHQGSLWSVDIVARALLRWGPASGRPQAWPQPVEPGCIAPRQAGGLLVARRDGVWDASGERCLAVAQHDPQRVRLNDGKADARGRFWVGGISDAGVAEAGWFCHEPGGAVRHH